MTQHDAIRLLFMAGGFLRATAWWLEQKQPLLVHDVATQLHALLNALMQIPIQI